MSQRHPLASEGAWVELRDPADFKSRDKRTVLRAIASDTQSGVALDLVEAIVTLTVVNWELPTQLPIPSTDPSVLDRLEIADYDKLCDLVDGHQDVLFPKAAEPTQEQTQDPASPTEPSAA